MAINYTCAHTHVEIFGLIEWESEQLNTTVRKGENENDRTFRIQRQKFFFRVFFKTKILSNGKNFFGRKKNGKRATKQNMFHLFFDRVKTVALEMCQDICQSTIYKCFNERTFLEFIVNRKTIWKRISNNDNDVDIFKRNAREVIHRMQAFIVCNQHQVIKCIQRHKIWHLLLLLLFLYVIQRISFISFWCLLLCRTSTILVDWSDKELLFCCRSLATHIFFFSSRLTIRFDIHMKNMKCGK